MGSSSFSPSLRKTTYDALSRKTQVSTWQASSGFNINESWRYQDYDAFDRPRKIKAPNAWEELIDYLGTRQEKRTVQIRTTETGTQATDRYTYRDALGRVTSTSNPEYATSFGYDPYDQQVWARRTGSGIDQLRSYGYDARGYLLWEDLPEMDTAYEPDTLGLPRQIDNGVDALTYIFDTAARLTEVQDAAGQAWRIFAYGSSNDGGNYRLGKLEHVLRYNDLSTLIPGSENLNVIETYRYEGALGKVSRQTTKLHYPDRPKGSQFGAAFEQNYTYDRFGNVTSQTYPTCVVNGDGDQPCQDGDDSSAPAHAVTRTYNQGIADTVVSSLGPSADLGHHFNFQVSQVAYGNGVTGVFDEGPAHLPRPRRIRYQDGSSTVLWDSGTFTFDGAGNISTIGGDLYTYDRASRMRSGTVKQAGALRREDLTYDAADNVTSFARDGGSPVAHNVDSATNRLLGRRGDASIQYDAAGSVTGIGQWPDGRSVFQLENDPLRLQSSFEITADDPELPSRRWVSGYGPGDVRLVVEDHNGERRWTFRDLENRVVREYLEQGGRWSHERDFVYGPSGLIASRRHNGMVRYFHADHLGTPRLYTAADGTVFSRHDYYPFGTEIEDTGDVLLDGFETGDMRYWQESKDEPRAEYTGHERDAHGLTDYMMARTYLYPFYRFGSPDPARDGWNLYTYVANNPIKSFDPNGKKAYVLTVGPGSGLFELFGHAALYVASPSGKRAGISLGGNHGLEGGLGKFVLGYLDEGRDVRLTVLDTNPEQDAAMIDFLTNPEKGAPDGGTDRTALGAGLMVRENCAQAVCNALAAGNVLKRDESQILGGALSLPSVLIKNIEDLDLVIGDYLFSPGDEKQVELIETALDEK